MKVDEELIRLKTILSRIRVGEPFKKWQVEFYCRRGSDFSSIRNREHFNFLSIGVSSQPPSSAYEGPASITMNRVIADGLSEQAIQSICFGMLKQYLMHECGEAFTFDYKRVFDPHNPKNRY